MNDPATLAVTLTHADGTTTTRTTTPELVGFWAEMPAEPQSGVEAVTVTRADVTATAVDVAAAA